MQRKKNNRFLLTICILFFLVALAWAASQLSGQANAAAADAGLNSLEMEKISLDMIKEPKPKINPPPCNWQDEKRLRKLLEESNGKYEELVAKAKNESSGGGKVTSETGTALQETATTYASLQEEYATMWDACNCKTRAKLARELAESRRKNADLVGNEINVDKIEAMQVQEQKLNTARQEYVQQAIADEELTVDDKKEVSANLIPRAQNVATSTGKLVLGVTDLLQQASQAATSATSPTGLLKLGASAFKGVSEGNIFQPLQALLTLCKGMVNSASALMSDLQVLSS